MTGPSLSIQSQTLAAMPVGVELRTFEIHKRVACWAPTSIRHALGSLLNRGLVERTRDGVWRRVE